MVKDHETRIYFSVQLLPLANSLAKFISIAEASVEQNMAETARRVETALVFALFEGSLHCLAVGVGVDSLGSV